MTIKQKYPLYILPVFLCGLLFVTCKKPYLPPAVSSSNSYLVVEGVINSGNDSTFIKLSRTVKIENGDTTNTERGATVSVESAGGTSYALTETKPGLYAAAPLNLDGTKTYRLKIRTKNGNQYLSDAVEVKPTPPIDKVNYVVKNDGLQLNVSAHDATEKTHYYRWDYEEDWRFHSKYKSGFKVLNDSVVPRTVADEVYYCFGNHKSNTITIASSTKLAQDVIADAPLTNIPSSSQKISMRYSILVKQYALTREAYGFYENMKKNTEQLGSIFDALPSELTGNIHNVNNPTEPVIGFVSVGTVQTKRIYINNADLPKWETAYPEQCHQDSALFSRPFVGDEVKAYIIKGLAMATSQLINEKGFILGYFRTDFICADCTLTGKLKQPAFWQDK